MSPSSIPAKLALLFTVVIGAIAGFFFWLVPDQLGEQAAEAMRSKAQSIGAMAAYSVRSAVVFDDRDAMREALDGAAMNPDVLYVAVASSDRQVLAHRQAPGGLDADAHPAPGSVEERSVYRVRIPVEWGGDTIAYVSLGMRASGVEAQVQRARGLAALVSALVFVVGMLAVLLGSQVVTRPLHEMVRTAQRISEGDLSERAEIDSRDEVGRLATTFNVMVGRLQAAHQALELSNRDLEQRVQQRTRELVDSEQQLRHAQKMEAVGRLAAGIAHDFNNLLTVINGHAELAQMQLNEGEALRDNVDSIATAGASAAALTHQLLAFSRKQVLQPIELDVNDVVREMRQILEGLVGEMVTLELDLQPGIGKIQADPSQLQQVIMNLAVNSKDAMPAGGRLTIRTRRLVVTGAEMQEADLDAGAYVSLEVADTGHGMSEQVKATAFEPFFSTKPAGKGTGLGLSTVYGIVSQSGGRVRLASEVGLGTMCSIYLPEVVSSGRSGDAKGGGKAFGGSERILLVEDATPVRQLARQMLEREGYEVVDADSGASALEILRREAGAFDLVLTDVVMPRMNGRELAEAVGRAYPHVSLIYMSGYTDDEVILAGVRDHDVTFIEKPFTRAGLLEAVRSVLDARRYAGMAH